MRLGPRDVQPFYLKTKTRTVMAARATCINKLLLSLLHFFPPVYTRKKSARRILSATHAHQDVIYARREPDIGVFRRMLRTIAKSCQAN